MSKVYLEKLNDFVATDSLWRQQKSSELHEKSKKNPNGLFRPLPVIEQVKNLSDLEKEVQIQGVKYRGISTRVSDVIDASHNLDESATVNIEGVYALINTIKELIEDLKVEEESVIEFKNSVSTDFNFDDLRRKVDKFDADRKHNVKLLTEFNLKSSNSTIGKEFTANTDQLRRYMNKVTEHSGDDQVIKTELAHKAKQIKNDRMDFVKDMWERYNIAREVYSPSHESDENDKGQKNTQEYIRHRVERIDSEITELTQGYKIDIHSLEDYKSMLERRLTDVGEGVVSEFFYPKRLDSPVVPIFEMYPPPSIDLKQDMEALQREVQERFSQFQWPSVVEAGEFSECRTRDVDGDPIPSKLNLAAKLSYHYMQPYNAYKKRNGVNTMLVHSTGSGKSCTSAIIASVFGRAGYTIMLVSKKELTEEIQKASIDNGCDFNVQQYTRGQPMIPTVLSDIRSRQASGDKTISSSTFLKKYGVLVNSLDAVKSTSPDDNLGGLDEYFNDIEEEPDEEPEEEPEEISKTETSKARKHNKEIESTARRYVQYEILEKGMGIDYYGDAISYKIFSNLEVPTQNKGSTERLLGRGCLCKKICECSGGHKERSNLQKERLKFNDKLRKVFIIIDEAHKLVTHPSDIQLGERPDFHLIREAIWDSYEKSGQDSCRVLLLTATPVVEHPMDAVNLATLLMTRDEVKLLGFEKYSKLSENGPGGINQKDATGKKFMQDHWDYKKNTFKYPEKIYKLFNGRISYFNYLGDASRFAQPFTINENGVRESAVTYVPVRLSVAQADLMVRCFKYPQKMTPEMGHIVVNGASGVYHYDTKREMLFLDKSRKIATNSRKIDKRKLQLACIGTNSVWPYEVTSVPGHPKLVARNLLGLPKKELNDYLKNDRNIIRESPLMYKLLQRILNRKRQAVNQLRQLYMGVARDTKFKNRMKGYKQYIFNDLTGATSQYGVQMIQAILESRGYHRVNSRLKSGPLIHKSPEDYMGMMVFDDSVVGGKDGGEATDDENTKARERQRLLLEYFNSDENVDGRECLLFIGSGLFKEGISLKDVRFAHIVGFLSNHADLSQAVARAIRNCSRKRTFYQPNRGWTIDINVYTPTFNPKDGSRGLHPLQLLEAYDPELVVANAAKANMSKLIQSSAYDRLLLDPINKASDDNLDAVQLWEGRRDNQASDSDEYAHLGSRRDVVDYPDNENLKKQPKKPKKPFDEIQSLNVI
jgi:hypothetical protein